MCSILFGARGGGSVVSHVDDALDTVNNDLLPERRGTIFGVTLKRCNAMAVGGNTTIN